MRVCLDTNVLVAAFATRGLCSDVLRTVLSEHDLVLGEVILNELRRVLEQKFGVAQDRLGAVEAVFDGVELFPKPASPSQLDLRDASDGWIVATAVLGEAEVLVTGDEDLLVLQETPLPILSRREFWEMLREAGD